MLALSDVVKTFGAVTAVSHLDLEVKKGETTVLIGPSGCGKSTVLRMMNGLIEPDSGEVQIQGELLNDGNIERVRHQLGYVIQEGGLFPHLTAYENVAILPRYLGWDDGRIRARMDELSKLTQLPSDLLGRFPRELSGGQRQRVSLMRALMPDPDILLLDEPLGSLDPMIRAGLQADLRRIFGELGKTVVVVTHDLAEAEFFADVIVLMRDGQIVQTGRMGDFVRAPAEPFVTAFVNAQRQTRGSA